MSGPYYCQECPSGFTYERGAWMHAIRTGHTTRRGTSPVRATRLENPVSDKPPTRESTHAPHDD